jgi:hypothetical protein
MGGEGGASCDADLENDAQNCGACGHVCQINGATPECFGGECRLAACLPTRHNLNGEVRDGCEYSCSVSNDGVELCDGHDNDCDGELDEDFDFSSFDNCGSCNNSCDLPRATSECVPAEDSYRCSIVECEAGWFDGDGEPSNGCEAACVESSDDPSCN